MHVPGKIGRCRVGCRIPQARATPATTRLAQVIRVHGSDIHRHVATVLLNLDPEAVHDARVSCRRLRATLEAFRPTLGNNLVRDVRNSIVRLTRRMGAVRDWDVFLAAMQARAKALSPADRRALAVSLVQWRRQREQFHARLAVTLQARPFTALLHALETLASRLESTGDETKTGGKTARSHVRRLLKRTRRFGRSIDLHAPDTKVHRLRIHCRKLRYACECLAAVCGDATARFTKRATRLQGVLGHHQDLSVASRRLRCALRSPVTCPTPASRAVLQTLLAQVAAEQKRSHRACLKAWRRFDRHPSQRALLNRLG